MEEREKALESLIPMASNVECLPLLLQSLPNVLASLAEHPVSASALCGVSLSSAPTSASGQHSGSGHSQTAAAGFCGGSPAAGGMGPRVGGCANSGAAVSAGMMRSL